MTGKNGYVDISGPIFTARVHWSETYDADAGTSVVSITDVQYTINNDNYAGTWYPGGTYSIDNVEVGVMNYNNPATHIVYAVRQSEFVSVTRIQSGVPFPWVSGPISHDVDGSKTVAISLNLKMYSTTWESSWGEYPSISGSVDIELTEIPTGLVYIDNGSDVEPCEIYIDNGESWDRCIPYIDNGESWDLCV